MPQWEGIDGEPPASSAAVSQAAVLFDIAYAASLGHHAGILTLARSTWSLQHGGVALSVALFLLTCVPTTCQWWDVSLFLARFDPGDLINEYILVLYMVLVVGQSLSIQDCATCLLSQNLNEPCALSPDPMRDFYYSQLRCSASGHADEPAAVWPALPFQCWVYLLLSLAPRIVHLLNALRAVRDVQPRGRRDAALQVVEQAMMLPLWLSAVTQRHSLTATMVPVCVAVCCQVLFLLVEPARRLHKLLERRGVILQTRQVAACCRPPLKRSALSTVTGDSHLSPLAFHLSLLTSRFSPLAARLSPLNAGWTRSQSRSPMLRSAGTASS